LDWWITEGAVEQKKPEQGRFGNRVHLRRGQRLGLFATPPVVEQRWRLIRRSDGADWPSPHGQGEKPLRKSRLTNWGSISTMCVLHGDTAVVQYGIGTFGSRGRPWGSGGLLRLQKLKEKIKNLACFCWSLTT
jgi:hypothetical protein